jgi:hypothetical protein
MSHATHTTHTRRTTYNTRPASLTLGTQPISRPHTAPRTVDLRPAVQADRGFRTRRAPLDARVSIGERRKLEKLQARTTDRITRPIRCVLTVEHPAVRTHGRWHARVAVASAISSADNAPGKSCLFANTRSDAPANFCKAEQKVESADGLRRTWTCSGCIPLAPITSSALRGSPPA